MAAFIWARVKAVKASLTRRLHLVLLLRACCCLKTFSPADSPFLTLVGTTAGVEGELERGRAALPPTACWLSSAKNLLAALRRPLRVGVFSLASLSLFGLLLCSSPISCPRRCVGTPALRCAFRLTIFLLPVRL